MSQTLKIANFYYLNKREGGQLDADAAASATSLTVVNSQDYANSDYMMVGRLGSENAELVTISGTPPTATTINTSALKFKHLRFEPLQSLFGNQIVIYRAANVNGTQPALASFAALGSPIAIDTDQLTTTYIDAAGGSGYWYAFTYKNATTSAETNLSDSPILRGGDYGNYTTLEAIRRTAGFQNNRNIDDPYVDTFRQAAQATIDNALVGRYVVPFTAPINPQIAEMAKLIAGYRLRLDQFPGDQDAKDGLKDVSAELQLLKEGNADLVGEDGTEQAANPTGMSGFKGWPDSTTSSATADQGGGVRMFRVSDVQGYGSRRY